MSGQTFTPATPDYGADSVTLAMEETIPPAVQVNNASISLPIDKRRRVLFAYVEPELSKKVFDWALHNIFNDGRDHVILADAYVSDPSNNILNAKKLWDLTAGEDDGVEFELKLKKEAELVEMHIESLRKELTKHQISSQKFILSVKDPRSKLVEIAELTKADVVVVGRSEPGLLERAVYGYLDDYLIRNCSASVFVINPNK